MNPDRFILGNGFGWLVCEDTLSAEVEGRGGDCSSLEASSPLSCNPVSDKGKPDMHKNNSTGYYLTTKWACSLEVMGKGNIWHECTDLFLMVGENFLGD